MHQRFSSFFTCFLFAQTSLNEASHMTEHKHSCGKALPRSTKVVWKQEEKEGGKNPFLCSPWVPWARTTSREGSLKEETQSYRLPWAL